MGQVLPYPGQAQVAPYPQPQPQFVYPTAVQGAGAQGHYTPNGYIPAFPVLASQIDTHARKLPWYIWAIGGAYLMFRLLKR